MRKVKNRKTVFRLAVKCLKANRMRNAVAILAIALTTMLFTAIFTIGMSCNEALQQNNFRQAGGYAHATFKYLTEAQLQELSGDPGIQEYGIRRYAGMATGAPFHKSHVEIGYSDENQRKWMYLDPQAGDFPQEGTKEAAADTHVLSLLGVEPVIGSQFTLTFDVDGVETTETFTLSGFWDYDEAIAANHVLIPLSRVEELFTRLNPTGKDGITGGWGLDMMFKGSVNIEKELQTILKSHNYQDQDQGKPDYMATGVNWGYTGAQFMNSLDPITIAGVGILMLLISFTGYLIIYNVFQISVTGDIRTYGLLKTIGTTPNQLRRMIRQQAFLLSIIGIPLGMLLGYLTGALLTPTILSRLNGVVMGTQSASPAIFIGSALFALVTVFLSCAKPGRLAARISPIEAMRYAGERSRKKRLQKYTKTLSLPQMAVANLGRTRGKTVLTIISLSLAILLLNLTFLFTKSFDMDKYLRDVAVDFILSDAGYFQLGSWNQESIDAGTLDLLQSQTGIIDGGLVYGKVTPSLEFVSETYFREHNGRYYSAESLDQMVEDAEQLPDGRISDQVQLYGMEDFLLEKLTILEGDLEKLKDPSANYIAAVYFKDDYGNPKMDDHWAQLGEQVTIRYPGHQDMEYEVAALVVLPRSLSYRYYGADEFILGAEAFIRDTGSDTSLYYAFDATAEAVPAIEAFLSGYTQNQGANYDYESKETYRAEFEEFRTMFLLMGSVLSFIIGLVGILNFLNAILTSIIARRKEFAILQSIGMTGRQLKLMLIWESLYYTLGSFFLCLILNLAAAPLLSSALESVFWFFSYQFTMLPILLCIPFMLLISFLVPYLGYQNLVLQSVVERLREVE